MPAENAASRRSAARRWSSSPPLSPEPDAASVAARSVDCVPSTTRGALRRGPGVGSRVVVQRHAVDAAVQQRGPRRRGRKQRGGDGLVQEAAHRGLEEHRGGRDVRPRRRARARCATARELHRLGVARRGREPERARRRARGLPCRRGGDRWATDGRGRSNRARPDVGGRRLRSRRRRADRPRSATTSRRRDTRSRRLRARRRRDRRASRERRAVRARRRSTAPIPGRRRAW